MFPVYADVRANVWVSACIHYVPASLCVLFEPRMRTPSPLTVIPRIRLTGAERGKKDRVGRRDKEDGVEWMRDRANVRWTVQDWERQRREFANQSRGRSLAAHFYVININYDYTWRINACSKTWLRYVYNSHVPFWSMIIDNKSISILLHYFVLVFFLFLNFCIILIYKYINR